MLIIVDLDGSVTDHRRRQRFAEKDPKDWDSYNKYMYHDPVVEPVAFLMGLFNLMSPTVRVEIWTGRPERFRDLTIDWLESHNIKYDKLRMRPDDDMRGVNYIKGEWLDEGHYPDFVIDDRDGPAEFWTSRGIICFHVKMPAIAPAEEY